MRTGKYQFGDQPPEPVGELRQQDSPRLVGRLVYGIRALALKATHRRSPIPLIPKPDQVKRLLVTQVEGLGDLVLTEPALRALRLLYPKADRVLIAQPYAAELFAGSGWGTISPPARLETLSKESPPFDLVIDLTLRVELHTASWIGQSGIPIRIGYDRAGRGVYYNITHSMPELTVPTRELHTRLISVVGAKATDNIPRLPKGEDRLRRGRSLWKKMKLESPVLLMPGAALAEQRWAVEKFVQVGQALMQQGQSVAVISGPGEQDLGVRLAELCGAPHIPSPGMLELMDRIATARVVVCNNTGPLHLAAALQVPTVSTMGPTNSWRWWPVSDAPTIVFRGGSVGPQGDLSKIDPIEVTAAVMHILDLG